ncbi:MAG TPA: BON domain-containing protein [Chitinophaga sp.]|uniref:BON domain-containing protein n=1 Tax=Chitinophaga sp. TaxID=1869181 RepID=UPI002DB5E9E6|nr:BON domain-containing protein [Chitinophaga sp.]HEU4556170.1 BON domain-containing protein [Chitinophaga sp.]
MKTDLQIQHNVVDELAWDPVLKASEIGVTCHEGVVTLSGYVNSYSKKLAAENAAKRVRDVKAVAMDIEIKLPSDNKRTDSDIAAAALNALRWNTFVPDDRVKLAIEEGWVTLEGELEWQYQKESAANAIKDLIGVRGISNLIKVRPNISAVVVKDAIKKALERSAYIEAAGINIMTDGGNITLKGKVRSWGERSEVERAAWATPGVLDVKDELVIAP